MSTRIRLARNFNDFPFPSRMKREDGEKVLNKVKEAIFGRSGTIGESFQFEHIQRMDPYRGRLWSEKHLISLDLAENQVNSGVIISYDEKISIMINEEDHLRIQCLFAGLQLKRLGLCNKVDNLLEETIDYASMKDSDTLPAVLPILEQE